ncbi:DUF262 domain-containing protein [Sorangium sp. So ce281]|uniref:DUF262 domain-containing protein n=1 Tax=unclassified Sorangium TaxID=2621164 RepID=UPI003F5D9D55
MVNNASLRVKPPSLDKRPEATRFRVEDLLGMVPEGRIRVPQFQRRWQWGPKNVEELFDSMYRGYPVGTLLLWKRRGEQATLHLGPHLFTVPQRDDALWVVDGQQRLTALVGVLTGQPDTNISPGFDLYFDLKTQAFTRPARHRQPEPDWIPMRVVVDAENLFAWVDEYRKQDPPKERVQLAFRLGKLIREYEMPAYVVDTDDEQVLRQVFRRVNTSGKPLMEADVFDALYGTIGQAQPGELREVAERLKETRFGEFEANLLLRSLRALLGQDVATDYDLRLPEGANPGDALARTERALHRVVTFFREDAHIPHIRLLPYEMTVVTLAVFFDRHPDPAPRSRELLARWVWRGAITGAHRGDTVALRSTLAVVRDQKETTSVSALLRALPEQPNIEPKLDRFNFRTARSKLETLALLALDPRDLSTGRPVTVTKLFRNNGREIPPALIDVRSESMHELELCALTVANRIVHPPIQSRTLRELAQSDVNEDILKSHGISRVAWKKLKRDDALGFLTTRGEKLKEHIEAFLTARAAWVQSDRPAIKSLVIADD